LGSAFATGFALYADANSSYDAREGTRIGRLLEAPRYGFYEEPCEFDDLCLDHEFRGIHRTRILRTRASPAGESRC